MAPRRIESRPLLAARDRTRRAHAAFPACLALLLMLPAASPCFAQWTLGAYIGGVHTSAADLRITQPGTATDVTFPATPFSGQSLESPLYYGYRIGRSIRGNWLLVEAELIHAKVYADLERAGPGAGRLDGQPVFEVPIGSVVQHFAMSHGLNFILFNGVVRQQVGHSRFAIAARGGIGPVLAHGETRVAGRDHEGYEWAGVGVQAAAGIELLLWGGLHGVVEYKFTRAAPRIDIAGGTAAVATRSQHLAVGAAWQFGQ